MALNILIVDDSPDGPSALQSALQKAGFSTVRATHWQQALALADQVQPDLILLSAELPGMSGIETARRLQRNPSSAAIPIVLVAERATPDGYEAHRRAGVTDVIIHPVNPHDLAARIQHIARLHKPLSTVYWRLLQEHRHTTHALQQQTQRLQAINQATSTIASATSFQHVIQASLESARYAVAGVSAALYLYDTEGGGHMLQVAALGPHYEQNAARQIVPGYGLIGQVARAAQAHLVADMADVEAIRDEYAVLGKPEVRSLLAVPLIAFDEVVGVLEVINRTDGVFDEQDLSMLETLAATAAIAIENSRLFDETHRRVNELRTLLDASAAVGSTLDFGETLGRIARRLSIALHVERVVVIGWTPAVRQLETLAEVVNAHWPTGSGPVRLIDHNPVIGLAVRQGRTVIAGDMITGDRPAPVDTNESGLHVLAAYPLIVDDRVVGVAAIYGETTRASAPQDLQAVTGIVRQWQEDVQAYDASEWSSRPNLTDLCQRALETSGRRWCEVWAVDEKQNTLHLARQVGHALWLDHVQHIWHTTQFPSLVQALETEAVVTLHVESLAPGSHERAYLEAVGGQTCLITPLFIRGEAGGVVLLVDSKPGGRTFDENERSLCLGIATVVGSAIDHAQLFTAQQQRASALEAAYQELQEADRMKDDLLQNLSHELRTPLTHMLGYLQLVLDGAFGELSPAQAETLQLINTKAQHLADLVQDVVNVQHVGAYDFAPEAIHLERIIAQAIHHGAARAHAKGIRIVPRIPPGLPLAYADPARMGDVFKELLENAIKFSPPATQIELVAEDTGGLMLHVYVQDQGIGIAPDQHEKIFRRFYQVERGTTRRFGGNGLGLTIVRQVIEGHRGRIWVESAPGEGSCFHFTIPKASAMTGT